MSKRLALLLALAALLLGAPAPALAEDAGGDTSAVAINTKDDSSLFKFAFAIKRVLGEVVDNQNAAVAYASCERCQTTAISIQIVLVSGSPTTVVPENYALSINQQCTLCQTFAAAFQFVIGVEDPSVGLTVEGKRQLRQILREFKALKNEQLTLEEFRERTKALGDRLRTVLATQLVSRRADPDAEDGVDVEADEDEESEQPAPQPTEPAETAPPPATTTEPPGATTDPPATTTEPPPGTTEPTGTTTGP